MTSARVIVYSKFNEPHISRVLLDTCSTANFITATLARKLKLNKTSCSLTIGAMNELNTTANYYTQLTFQSIYSEFKQSLTFFVVPKIIDATPSDAIPREQLNLPPQLRLADPEFHKPAPIDLLIGSGPSLSLFCTGQIKLPDSELILQKTKLGWIIGGGLNTLYNRMSSKCMLTDLQFDLEKFWTIEELPADKQSRFSKEEQSCENHFKSHVQRNSEGRYVVALPFKKPIQNLGNSRNVALKRLTYMKRKFDKNKDFAAEYTKTMNDYLEQGHMSPIDTNCDVNSGFYLSHHAVLKESSNTTKLRVVFDASAKSSTNTSLNDLLLVGPTIQDDLFTLLLRFRTHPYVILADIEKMYRQFLIRKEDRIFQKILWFINDQIQDCVLNTVTFGVSSAPFLAIRCLKQLAVDEEENFPLAAAILKNDMYVDNMITGCNSVEQAKEICKQVTGILKSAGMKMRQWASNDSEILGDIEKSDLDVNFSLDENNSIKTLGVFWRAKNDEFIYKINSVPINRSITKREILSEIAKIFDPLGLLGPIILFAKKLMQEIWKSKVDWDESISSTAFYAWITFCTQLNALNQISFGRLATLKDYDEIQLHGFCDASEAGYGACIYLRSRTSKGEYKVVLLCSKSRVAPVKTRTIPRLELCAMQLLANLYQQVISAITIKIIIAYLHSDASIPLNWSMAEPYTLKTFVANRVADIQSKTEKSQWHHVRSQENPADALSRGQYPNEFLENRLWRCGPPWLLLHESQWPQSDIPGLSELPEKKKAQCLLTAPNPFDAQLIKIINKYSSYSQLKRIFACFFMFYKDNREHKIKAVERGEMVISRLIQQIEFSREINCLKNNRPLDERNRIAPLDPFLDRYGVLRVGGRIRKAIAPFTKKHPILLPIDSRLTDMIIRYYHCTNLHTGVQNTLYALREKFWLLGGRNQIKKAIKKCLVCFRAKPTLCSQKMGNLPSVRVTESRPFSKVGVDYCGPFSIKEKKRRNTSFIKCYVAVFVCMATKAVHLEVVDDLTAEGFIAALIRFTARRGLPTDVYSDNGTNFRGAHTQLNELFELLRDQKFKQKVENFAIERNIQWHFIPPHAPNFGGLWENMVKQFKHHFKRIASDKKFRVLEFITFTAQVEAILNSRPITQMSNDINDYTALTPGHFLIGDSLNSIPEHDYTQVPTNRLSSWENINKLKQEFWNRWHNEYITSLNMRSNKKSHDSGLKKGLLVLVQDDNLPSMQWNLGRVEEVHPGTDNIIRAATIRMKNGLFRRPSSKLAILPIDAQ